MEFSQIIERARAIRAQYKAHEIKQYGREWEPSNLAQGFVGDVGDLMKLITAKEGLRTTTDVDQKLAHELADCLWSVIVLADAYGIDLEQAFAKTMDQLEVRLKG